MRLQRELAMPESLMKKQLLGITEQHLELLVPTDSQEFQVFLREYYLSF
jgi:hypothetical protein